MENLRKSKYYSGYMYDPKNNIHEYDFRVESFMVLSLTFKSTSPNPEISICIESKDENTTSSRQVLKNIKTFEQFSELFSILKGNKFDLNNW